MKVVSITELKKKISTKTLSEDQNKKGSKVSKVSEAKKLQKSAAPIFHLEKLGLRSGIGDLAENWHHYLYGTEKGR